MGSHARTAARLSLSPLTQAFTRSVRRRHSSRHFARKPLLSTLTAHGNAPALPATVDLPAAARADAAELLARLGSSAAGLDAAEAARRLALDGLNEIQHERPLPPWLRLWHGYLNPFNLLLSALAALSWLSADPKATVVIGCMVTLSTGIRFVQEGRSHRAAESLRALVGNTATVIRRGGAEERQDIPLHDLVAGDIVALSAGDMVPADCRVLTARDLFVAQAALTGESLPVEKSAQPAAQAVEPMAAPTLVFMGTSVVSGSATALVLATGARSTFGTLAAHACATETTPNAFQAGVNSVSWLLIRFAAVMVPVVFVINGLGKGDWLQAFLFALSVAVGLTPEMLPMIVTATLARGAVALARRQVVVKRLDAIQNLGAMQVLCTDKTGTLTQDRIALARHVDPFGNEDQAALQYAYVNSHFQTGLKNLLDHAVLEHAELAAELALAQRWRKIDEIPFDFERRRMSVVVSVAGPRGEHHELVCKGAVAEVLAACTRVRVAGGDTALDAALRARSLAACDAMSAEGLRVVAVATKNLPAEQARYAVVDEAGLTLVGYIGFLDPPKDSAAPALRRLADHGVGVKLLTGDNETVAARVCQQVGLAAGPALLGAQVEAMDEATLRGAARAHTLFARLTPLQKERVVRALRAGGQVVGFMGDGINDAPALRAADVGISVDTAVDIAKEAADIILLEKSLLVLDDGVIEGRRTFCNMLKYIRMTASSNFGNVLSVLVASAFLPFLPMLPLQLLVQNLLYDVSQTGIPFDAVDDDLLARPLQWHPADVGRFMLCFGPISSLFDLALFAVMWWVFAARDLAQQGLFQSGWFVLGLLTQTLVVHLLRTPRLPFVHSRASAPVMALTLAVAALGLWLPMGPLAPVFGLQPLPAAYFAWLAGLLLAYGAMVTLMKRAYLRHHGWQ